MAKLKFDDLGEEIKALVIDHLLRPSDLKNVCLVNKQLHQLAVKPLYRSVALEVGSANDTHITAFLSPSNVGLKHIKQIRLYLASVRDKCNQEQQAHLVSRMIIQFLPKDILEEFSWCPWNPFSSESLMQLYKTQRNMKWLEVMDLDRDILPELKKNDDLYKNAFQHTRKLALYPETRETLRLCEYFIQKTQDTLEALIIHANFNEPLERESPARNSEYIESRELNDSATGPGLLSRTIFSHQVPFEKCEPFKNLKTLRLHRINLRHCAETWCKAIKFMDIEALRLYQCPGADSLFGQLSRAAHLPKQLRVLEFQHSDNSEEEALLALDGFLCLVSGLQEIVIDLEHVKSLPAAAGIARHGKTLRVLNIHSSSNAFGLTSTSDENDELVWSNDDFNKICQACSKLEQLSCAFPTTSVLREPSTEWLAFEAHLRDLRELVTLHITTFPNSKPYSQLLPRNVYSTLLQSLALRLFVNAANALSKTTSEPEQSDKDEEAAAFQGSSLDYKLRLVAFGISDKIYEREDSKNLFIWAKSRALDCLGGFSQIHATPVTWCLRQYVEPRSEVLDFVLHREAKSPTREVSPSGLAWGDDDDFDA